MALRGPVNQFAVAAAVVGTTKWRHPHDEHHIHFNTRMCPVDRKYI